VSDTCLTVVRSGLPLPPAAAGELVVSDLDVRAWVRDGRIRRHIRQYAVARLVTERLSTSGRPMLMWALRLMARRCYIVDAQGLQRNVTVPLLLRWSRQLALELALRRRLLRRVDREIAALALPATTGVTVWNRTAPVLYLRTDLSFGVRAGGSVGHIAGVVNELARIGASPIMLTTAPVPTVESRIESHVIAVPEAFWNFCELPALVLNQACYDEALRVIDGRRVSLVYQRYSLDNYAGLRLARRLRVPFVLEYNGSEVWMSRHWNRALKYETFAERIERLNVTQADLVVVVSRAMRDELAERGLAHDRILVNPNGVDPDRYTPSIDGTAVRERCDLGGATVIGFISTFQPWHGAETLARAFVRLMQSEPSYADRVRLLMIGTGPRLEAAREIIAAAGFDRRARFTGLVEQEHGPQYLAACDILASPHVPNPDGTPFFGSPTKLFEYMAMGRAIVASDLDQIGEVLRHGQTAWLVPAADADALAAGLRRLVDDSALRAALGDAARRAVLAQHTWRAHVLKILAALESRAGVTAA
jgi:glycosyltransferase involved in cell wall biosynthesis